MKKFMAWFIAAVVLLVSVISVIALADNAKLKVISRKHQIVLVYYDYHNVRTEKVFVVEGKNISTHLDKGRYKDSAVAVTVIQNDGHRSQLSAQSIYTAPTSAFNGDMQAALDASTVAFDKAEQEVPIDSDQVYAVSYGAWNEEAASYAVVDEIMNVGGLNITVAHIDFIETIVGIDGVPVEVPVPVYKLIIEGAPSKVTAPPTSKITPSPTPKPTPTPSGIPTEKPTPSPTPTASEAPTATPTGAPTETPTSTPTSAPTSTPTSAPTEVPTVEPTEVPPEDTDWTIGEGDEDTDFTIGDDGGDDGGEIGEDFTIGDQGGGNGDNTDFTIGGSDQSSGGDNTDFSIGGGDQSYSDGGSLGDGFSIGGSDNPSSDVPTTSGDDTEFSIGN